MYMCTLRVPYVLLLIHVSGKSMPVDCAGHEEETPQAVCGAGRLCEHGMCPAVHSAPPTLDLNQFHDLGIGSRV